jgi:hypothetical protein
MIDETLNQPAAPGAPITPPQMEPQAAPPAPPPQEQAPAPKQSVWKSVVQGALVGLANSGGANSFGSGLGAGAQGVMKHQQQQTENQMAQQRESRLNANMESEIKFRDVQSAGMLANLSRLDQQMDQQSQEFKMKLDTHAQNQIKFFMDNLGMQFDAIPNSGDSAMGYLKQLGTTSEDGQVALPSGVVMSPSTIYVPKQGQNTAEQEWEFARKMSPIFGLPVPPKETFIRLNPQQRNAALSPIQSLMAGHSRTGEFLSIDKLPQAVAHLRTSIARAEKDPQTDPKALEAVKGTLTLLEEQLKEAKDVKGDMASAYRPGVYIATQSPTGEVTGFYNNRNPQDFVAPPQQGLRKSALPAQENADRASFATLVGQFNRLKETAAKRTDAIGPVSGRVGSLKAQYVGGDDEAASMYQTAADIQNQLIYLFSGKQINEAEYKRLKATFPSTDLPYDTFVARLKNFEGRMNEVYKRRTGQDINSAGAPAAPQGQPQQTADPLGIR